MSKIIELKDKVTNETLYPTVPYNLVTDFKGTNIYGKFNLSTNNFSKEVLEWSLEKIKNSNYTIKSLIGLEIDLSTKQLSTCITENSIVNNRLNTLNEDITVDKDNTLSVDSDVYNSGSLKSLINEVLDNYIYFKSGIPQYAPIGKEIYVDENTGTIYFGVNNVWYSTNIDDSSDFSAQDQTLIVQGYLNFVSSSGTMRLSDPLCTVDNTTLNLN